MILRHLGGWVESLVVGFEQLGRRKLWCDQEVINVVSERGGVAEQSTDGKVSVDCMLALHRDSHLGITLMVELSHFKGRWL